MNPSRPTHPLVSSALALLIALLLLPGAALRADTPVRIGVQDRIAHAVLALADARGDFSAAGIEVDLIATASPLDSLLDDEADLLAVTADTLIGAERAGIDLRGALLLAEARQSDVLFGEPDLQRAGGLRGARVGVVSGASGTLLLAAELQRRGLKLADVTLETVSLDQAIARWLEPGDEPALQAVVVAAPASIDFQVAVMGTDSAQSAAHPITRLGDGARNAGLITDLLAGDDRWLRANKEAVKAVIRAWDRAVAALRRDPDASLALLAERSGSSSERLQRSLDGVELFGLEDNIQRLRGAFQKRFSAMSQVLARTESARARGVPSANRFLSLAALRQVAAGR